MTNKHTRTIRVLLILTACAALVYAYSWGLRRRKRTQDILNRALKVRSTCSSISPSETIFVSIASYRDPECPETLYDCFEKSGCPRRIVVGLCQQNSASDQDSVRMYRALCHKRGTPDYSSRIRVFRMDASEAKGPMYARAMIDLRLVGHEKYYMVIDSHTAFEPDWDCTLIRYIESTRQISKKPVLTMYPDDYHSNRGPRTKTPASYLRVKRLNPTTQLPEIESAPLHRIQHQCIPSLFWAACFSFADNTMPREVPFDSSLPYVFQGEEITMAMRLYTHGYDMYVPPYMVVRHKWARTRPTFWEQFDANTPTHAQRRQIEAQSYTDLVRRVRDRSICDQGCTRTLEQYEQFCGVHFLEKGGILPRAWLGVTEHPTLEEIQCKFKSQSQYQTELGRRAGE